MVDNKCQSPEPEKPVINGHRHSPQQVKASRTPPIKHSKRALKGSGEKNDEANGNVKPKHRTSKSVEHGSNEKMQMHSGESVGDHKIKQRRKPSKIAEKSSRRKHNSMDAVLLIQPRHRISKFSSKGSCEKQSASGEKVDRNDDRFRANKRLSSKERMNLQTPHRHDSPEDKANDRRRVTAAGTIFVAQKNGNAEEGAALKKVQKKEKPVITRQKLEDGDNIKSERFTWRITKLLNYGVFGDVYKVIKMGTDEQEYALKTEAIDTNSICRLNKELKVLKQCQDTNNPDMMAHFLEFIDYGATEKFKFMVMALAGPTIYDLQHKHLPGGFSKDTVMNIAIQTLKAIGNLHYVGFVHRDIRPRHFAVGLEPNEAIIYILDFGFARSIYVEGTKTVRPARQGLHFLGTVRYASRCCHTGGELSQRDDLESWLYMIYEIFDSDTGLPWKRIEDRNDAFICKEKFFKHELPICYSHVPKDMKMLVDVTNKLAYGEEPKYNIMIGMLMGIGRDEELNYEKEPDWVEVLGKSTAKKDKKAELSPEPAADERVGGGAGSGEGESRETAQQSKPPASTPPK